MRYTPMEILKDEAQALFQFEQEMTKKIFDENLLSSLDQELVDQKSLYRAIEVMQESILKPKELRKLFGEMDTQNDEAVFTNLDQFTDKFGNYIDALSPIFSILKNIYSVNVNEKSEVDNSSDMDSYVTEKISILEDEIVGLDEDISFLEQVREGDFSSAEYDNSEYFYKISKVKLNESAIESARTRNDVRPLFDSFVETELKEVFSFLKTEMKNIENIIKELNKKIEINKLENLSHEDLWKIDGHWVIIDHLESIVDKSDKLFLRVAAMCLTLNQMLLKMNLDASDNRKYVESVRLSREISEKLGKLLEDNFDNLGIGGFKKFDYFQDMVEYKLQALMEKLNNKKWACLLVDIKFKQDLNKLVNRKNEKQDEIKELQKVTIGTPSKPQKIERVKNHDLQDFSLSLERMKERNKSLKQCIEKYI